MHHLKCHASSHDCLHLPCIGCASSSLLCFGSSRLDDDCETDEVYENSSEELAQYQATELEASIHSHESLIPVTHWIPFFPLSILLALLFDACVPIPSHVHRSPDIASCPNL